MAKTGGKTARLSEHGFQESLAVRALGRRPSQDVQKVRLEREHADRDTAGAWQALTHRDSTA